MLYTITLPDNTTRTVDSCDPAIIPHLGALILTWGPRMVGSDGSTFRPLSPRQDA